MPPVAVVRHISEGQLQTRRVSHAKGIHVVLPEVLDPVSQPGPGSPENGPPIEVAVADVQDKANPLANALERLELNAIGVFRDAVAVLKEELAAKDRQLAQRDRQIAELHAILAASSSTPKARRGLIHRLCAL